MLRAKIILLNFYFIPSNELPWVLHLTVLSGAENERGKDHRVAAFCTDIFLPQYLPQRVTANTQISGWAPWNPWLQRMARDMGPIGSTPQRKFLHRGLKKKKVTFSNFLTIRMCVLHVGMCLWMQVLVELKQGCLIPFWSYWKHKLPDMGARNFPSVLYKRSKYSLPWAISQPHLSIYVHIHICVSVCVNIHVWTWCICRCPQRGHQTLWSWFKWMVETELRLWKSSTRP